MTAAGGTVNPKKLNSDFHFLCKCWTFSISLQFRGFSKLSRPPTNPSLFSSRSPWIRNISRGPFCCPDWKKSFSPFGLGRGGFYYSFCKGKSWSQAGAGSRDKYIGEQTHSLHNELFGSRRSHSPQSVEETASVSP